MCEFVGFSSSKKDLLKDVCIIKNMNKKLQKQNKTEGKYFYNKNINLACMQNIYNVEQPISIKYNDIIYTLVFDGQIYNKEEIKDELSNLGYELKRKFGY